MSICDSIPDEADVVVVGGGTTGLVVASRLAQADPTLSILVLEHGPDVRDNPQVINPALFSANLAPGSNTTTVYESEPSEFLGGRRSYVPTGGCLGGGSSVNFQVYVRPQEIDFDDWGVDGWAGKDMIPFFKKFENFQDTDPGIDKSLHGYGGPLSVSSGSNAQAKLQQDYFDACQGIGIEKVADMQDFKAANAVGKWNMWVDERNGFRQNTPRGFLYPVLDKGNTSLQVATDTKVARILFDSDTKRASGVEYVVDQTGTKTVHARKQVILAAGALGSPQILERSGVGNASLLSKLGIPSVSVLPGVGTNYQDHNLVLCSYKSTADKDGSLDELLSGRLSLEEALTLKESSPDRYILGWNGVDCFGKFRPTDNEVKSFAPCLQELWERDFKNRPTKPMMLFGIGGFYLGDYSAVEQRAYMTAIPYTAYPYSTGSVHIKSTSPFDTPTFDAGYLTHPADIEQLMYGYKIQREILRRMAHYDGIVESTHPKFPTGSKADYAYVDALSKEKGFAVPIEYSAEDDDVIREYIRKALGTTWHSIGTCAMKEKDVGGVVDDRLNVYGVQGLKIVDVSICPKNVGANTYATAVAIGEKAATIVAADLGIQIE